MTVTGSVPFIGFHDFDSFAVFRVHDQIISAAVVDPAHYWQRWTGSGWNSERIPWPANLRTDINHYITRVIALANTNVLIVTDDGSVMTYDGSTMSAAVAWPVGNAQHAWGFTQDASGAYHVFWGTQEYVSKPDGTWYPPAPVPMGNLPNNDDVRGAAAIMRDGREVVMFLDDNIDAPATHVHVLSHAANGPWTAEMDITPTWRVNAHNPRAYAPPGGGIVLAADADTTPAIWTSATGTSFGDYAYAPGEAIGGECLDSLVLVGTSGASIMSRGVHAVFEQQGSSWVPFGFDQLPAYTYDVVGVATLPGGKTFMVVSSYTGKTDYLVSP